MTDLRDRRLDLHFDDNGMLAMLCGEHDRNLTRIEAQLGISLISRGNLMTVAGPEERVDIARLALQTLWRRLDTGLPVTSAEVDAAVRMAQGETGSASGAPALTAAISRADGAVKTRGRPITPRTPCQARYLEALKTDDLVFGIGPAGTGKTYLAAAQAVALLTQGAIRRIVLSRPAVEAGERLGFLPGDLREKVDPYLRPLYDALGDMLPADQVARRLANGDIEVAPLAFMRGRTLSDAFVILDEAQNTTPMQMKMILTRLGDGSRMAVTGDVTQVDLPHASRSGLIDALDVLDGVQGVSVVRFEAADVVRHPLVARIVRAYAARDEERCVAGARWGEPRPEGALRAVAGP